MHGRLALARRDARGGRAESLAQALAECEPRAAPQMPRPCGRRGAIWGLTVVGGYNERMGTGIKRVVKVAVLTIAGGVAGTYVGSSVADVCYPGWDAPKFDSEARAVEVGRRVVVVAAVCGAIAVPLSLAKWLDFRFSLRVLLAVVTITVLLLAFMFNQLSWIRQRTEYLETASFVYDGPQPNWVLWILGEDGVESLAVGPFAENADPAYAKALFPEAKIIDPRTGAPVPIEAK